MPATVRISSPAGSPPRQEEQLAVLDGGASNLHARVMKTRAELLAKYEAWEAAQAVKREAAKAEREAPVAAPPADRVGYRDQVRAVWAKPEPTPCNELSPEQQRALKQLREAAGDPGIFDGAVSESVLGGVLFPWQAVVAHRQAKAQRKVNPDN